MNTKQIFVVGSCNTDMVIKAARLPAPGETVLGGTFFTNAGGKGANQAVAAARLGGNVTLVSKVGNDIHGKQLIETLQKENINTDFVFIDEMAPTGAAMIIVNDNGENCIVVAQGSNANLSHADLATVGNIFKAEVILIQLETPVETVAAVIKSGEANHQKIILNPAPAQKLDDQLLHGLFLITPNETEASALVGITVNDEGTASLAARLFLNRGVQNVLITMGSKGAYFRNRDLALMINAPLVNAVDTTAAGDTFNGAIAVAITENLDWEKAIHFAVNAASISVTRMGAQASMPFRNEIRFI